MKSFGWDTTDSGTQHDAQELNRILCDRLEEQMKGTPMDGSIKRLFEGEMENYIECLDVDSNSKRRETFYDIQLSIKSEKGNDLQTIEESPKEFTADEMLDGDNLYKRATESSVQKRASGLCSSPQSSTCSSSAFTSTWSAWTWSSSTAASSSHFGFISRKFAPGAGHYHLHSIVVHRADVNSGHSYAYIRRNLDERWVKFDDEKVTHCSEFEAVEDNFGGSDPRPSEFKGWPSRPAPTMRTSSSTSERTAQRMSYQSPSRCRSTAAWWRDAMPRSSAGARSCISGRGGNISEMAIRWIRSLGWTARAAFAVNMFIQIPAIPEPAGTRRP